MSDLKSKATFSEAIVPIAFFLGLIVYGLFIHPVVFEGGMLPLEVLVLMAICFTSYYLIWKGYTWEDIQKHIIHKIGESIPVVLILLAIGVLIGSWIVCGTIPMLIHFGISVISPDWIYLFSFLICIIFSLLTGTSWGSAGTIGVVMIGISQVFDANIAITASAVVGGSFFGDKLSPLSDTTNIASLASGVKLYDHIHSMLFTTGPAAIIAALFYAWKSPYFNDSAIKNYQTNPQSIEQTLTELSALFNFNLFLLLPMVIVIYGTVTKKSIFLTLLNSAWVALILALIFQDFSLINIVKSLNSGFNTSMSTASVSDDSIVLNILNRGGLYNLIEGVMTCLLIFTFIGLLDVLNAIEVSIAALMRKLKNPWQLVTTTLSATLVTNLTTSNQYATSFIIGSAFSKKYEELKVHKKVLSRSIEDAGTMMENLVPWTPSGIFMAKTLGVAAFDYAPYQVMSIANILIAYFFAISGIAIFKNSSQNQSKDHAKVENNSM